MGEGLVIFKGFEQRPLKRKGSSASGKNMIQRGTGWTCPSLIQRMFYKDDKKKKFHDYVTPKG